MTKNVNQDVVENLFSFLKGMCGSAFNSITTLQFKYACVKKNYIHFTIIIITIYDYIIKVIYNF